MKKVYHERNDYILQSKEFNPTYETILWMSESEFRNWVVEFRKFVVKIWDEHGVPPKTGYTEEQIIDQFNQIENFPVHKFVCEDELTDEADVIRNTHTKIGNGVNQWFPTMQKTKINYNASGDGRSIYDYVADPDLLETYTKMASRVFRRDGYYLFSNVVRANNKETCLIHADNGVDWIKEFESNRDVLSRTHDYWLQEKESGKGGYTGYNLKLKEDLKKTLSLSSTELLELWDEIPENCKTTFNKSEIEDQNEYLIRLFKRDQNIFPPMFRSFKVSLCQNPSNFPPLTAKFLYQKYTEDIKDQEKIVIWDPSAGWAGRLLGAMGCKADRNIHYIGTDPNEDFSLPDGKLVYDHVAEFYNTKTYRGHGLFPHNNTYEIYQTGSECMQFEEGFQKYKGKVDFIFTSPPYFNREQYSDDDAQSYKKFSNYDSWRDGFLYETLLTAVTWLKPGRFLAWNVADVKVSDKIYLPIETDSIKFLNKLGMEHVMTWKMALAQMPGANRTDDDGNVTAKNACKVNGVLLKYEPIFIWRKPL